jgi:hypothetical protein
MDLFAGSLTSVSTDYPLLAVSLTMVFFFLFVLWLVLVVLAVTDIVRRADIGGPTKAFFTLCVVVLPYFGAIVYLIARRHRVNA